MLDSLVVHFPLLGIQRNAKVMVTRTYIKEELQRVTGTYRARITPVGGQGKLYTTVRTNAYGTTRTITAPAQVNSIPVRGRYQGLYNLMLCKLAKTAKPKGL